MYQRMIFISSRTHLKTNMMSLNSSVNRLYLSLGNVANYSSSKMYYDIVIAGGGMVGCAMACKLSKEAALRGMSILLLEGGPNRKEYDLSAKKNTLDRPYSNRVSAVSKSSVQLLQSIGAWQIIEDLGRNNAVKEMRIWNSGAGRSGGINNVLTFDNDNDLAYIVENDTILGALYKQINEEQNITVNYDTRVNQCDLSDSHRDLATVKVANGEISFETSLLIGSDGYGSKVRSAISGQQYIGWEYGQRAVVATLHIQSDEDDTYKGHVAWQKFAQLGPVALLPLDDKTCSLVWTTSYEEANRLAELSDNEFIDALNDSLSEEKESNNSSLLLADDAAHIFAKVLNKYCQSNDENKQNKKIKSIPPIVVGVIKDSRASFPLGFGHACQYVGQRVALVGDAAHRIHPLAGQGVNLGFSDVTELSNQLNQSVLTGADIGDLNALLNYQTAAQRRNVPIMLGVDGIQKIYGSKSNLVPPAITTLIRNVGLTICQSASIVKVCIFKMKLMIIHVYIIYI
ncbi:ubiquinone biosynthesis monooxygenase COQ6, mitochondrial isoform X1 [Metopolophium dirhodum]|uniref:ubiquinone biosynthesis monooxygenase COQ6, mitochondrial isoform X1 n=1 Tax=Metopolophium dirhodum TaxID=44670 RepID=UPI00299021C0|nr:ubiquinone biosynthesis monooxygenase COQ6, mitochondrial isoform X1 [Metopolophium dirhodum]XP_060878426.1 ubiquinone biosynthesis monooxygenase COQ6, mitochondrial isoform X1 [Metopolophium dirhodum]XP_060878427.1 ubiquinone biosynthesis monooxygenase COQ6, mitochondrial isoform X1 [Metopolophium dirhodum]